MFANAVMNRRQLLRQSALAGGAWSLATIAPKAFSASDAPALRYAGHLGAFNPSRTHFPSIIVGSGYGGAVTALRLSEVGEPTLMLEMGQLWDQPGRDGKVFCKMARPDERAMWMKDRTEAPLSRFLWLDVIDKSIPAYAGVLDRLNFKHMSVYLGRGVGGGSLVNGGMAVTPDRSTWERMLPIVDAERMYGNYFPLARHMLGVATAADELLENSDFYRYTRVSRRQADNASLHTVRVPNIYDFDYMLQEDQNLVPRSAFAGEIIYGNNAGKRSLDQTYLARALQTQSFALKYLHRVDRFWQTEQGQFRLEVSELNSFGDVVTRKQLSCDRLFLCAGSVGTSSMLVKAKGRSELPRLNAKIGQGWGNNGNVMTARANHIWNTTGRHQSTIPIMGIDDWNNPDAPVFAEIAPFPTGFETWVSLYLAITGNPHRGYFSYNPQTDDSELNWSETFNQESIRMAKSLFDRLNQANSTIYRSDLFGGRRTFAEDFTYHPLGGCVLGEATDAFGRIREYPGLYVNDGALIPGNTGVNPFLSITALAERNIDEIRSNDLG